MKGIISKWHLCFFIILLFQFDLWASSDSISIHDFEKSNDSIIIDLDKALLLMFKNNPDIQEAKYSWLSKSKLKSATYGAFEPRLNGKILSERAERPGALFTETKDEYRLGIRGLLPTGTEYDIGFNQTTYQHSDYTSELYFGGELKQPLLKGLFYSSPMNAIKQASAEEHIYFHQYRETLINIIEKLETAYWNFYYAQQNFLFEKESLNITKQILDDAHKRLEQGKISVLEQQKATAELSKRESRLLDALGELRQRQIDLLILIASPSLFKKNINLTISPSMDILNFTPSDSNSLYDSLIRINPNYLAQKYELEKRNLSRDSYIGERLPSVNLIGSYGIRSRDDNAKEAITKFKSDRKRQTVLSGGIEIEIPLFSGYREKYMIESENQLIRASEFRLKLMSHYLIENTLILQKRIVDLVKQISYENAAVNYHKQELQEEFFKLNAGKSNLNIIFEKEEDLRIAQKKELEIFCQFHLHLIQLEKSKGSLLLKHQLETHKENTFLLRNDLL